MKKLLLVLGVAGFFALSSCNKDYTCTCDDGSTSGEVSGVSKSTAEDFCSDLEDTANAFGGTNVSCSLD